MLAGMFFLTACAINPEPQNMEEPPSWSVGLTWGSTGSGATSYAHPVLLAGFTGTMDEASVFCCWYDPVSSTWQDGTPPVLDRYASLNLVAISCGETTKDLTSLPQSLVADASHQELWLMDYQAEATKGHVNLRLHHKTTCLPVPFRRVPSPPLCAGCYKCRCAPAARCHNSRFVIH